MGSWFSNIQIKYDKEIDTLNAEHIASLLARKRGMEKTDQAHADIEIAVYIPENSGWATVASDLMDGDGAALLACAGELSAILKTETIAISCMDSDYLFLNLIDAEKGTDAWAACGRYPDGKAPRRSNFAPWQPYTADWKAFRKAMKGNMFLQSNACMKLSPCFPSLRSRAWVRKQTALMPHISISDIFSRKCPISRRHFFAGLSRCIIIPAVSPILYPLSIRGRHPGVWGYA